MKNIKLYFIVLCLVVILEYIGIVKFNFGKGVIVLFLMLYVMVFGVFIKFLKIVNEKDMEDVGLFVSVILFLLMVKYGIIIGFLFLKLVFVSFVLIL